MDYEIKYLNIQTYKKEKHNSERFIVGSFPKKRDAAHFFAAVGQPLDLLLKAIDRCILRKQLYIIPPTLC
jgi:hypothetical protein